MLMTRRKEYKGPCLNLGFHSPSLLFGSRDNEGPSSLVLRFGRCDLQAAAQMDDKSPIVPAFLLRCGGFTSSSAGSLSITDKRLLFSQRRSILLMSEGPERLNLTAAAAFTHKQSSCERGFSLPRKKPSQKWSHAQLQMDSTWSSSDALKRQYK